MGTVRVVADWGCDISPAEAERLAITLVPVFVNFGSETVSSEGLSSDDFWVRASQAGVPPTTAAPSPGSFGDAFRRLVNAGHDVVCLTLPSRYSSTFNSAWVAAQEFGDHVRVVDSGSISLGMGLQVLRAAQDALSGQSAEAIQRALENLRERTSVLFVLDSLEWARRGGRLERLLPIIDRAARTLNVKPVVELTNGEFRLIGIVRSMHGAVQRIQEEMSSRAPLDALAAAYTRGRGAAIDLAGSLAAASDRNPADIMVVEAGPVFAAHAGPGAIGAAIIRS